MREIGPALVAGHSQMGLTGHEDDGKTQRFLRFAGATDPGPPARRTRGHPWACRIPCRMGSSFPTRSAVLASSTPAARNRRMTHQETGFSNSKAQAVSRTVAALAPTCMARPRARSTAPALPRPAARLVVDVPDATGRDRHRAGRWPSDAGALSTPVMTLRLLEPEVTDKAGRED